MAVWPKSIHTFRINLQTAAAEWRLRQKDRASRWQQAALAALTPRLAAAGFWKRQGIEAGMPYRVFQSRVPLHAYASLAPAVEEMKRGAADVLWPGSCALFAWSAGTSTGERKCLPVTEELLVHCRRAIRDALLYYTVRVRHAGVFRGRHLAIGGPTALLPLGDGARDGAFAGEWSAILAATLPAWAEKHLFEPGRPIGRLAEWDARVEAILNHASARDISLVAGLPQWLTHIAGELRERCYSGKQRIVNLRALWPNLECVLHTGAQLGPFASRLRDLLGPRVNFHEVYAATEAFVAAQDSATAPGLRLMADAGVFFEFLPLAEFEEKRLDQLGPKAVPLEDVRTETDYVLVITTPGGLARYVLGDVVRFVSTEPPRVIHVGGTQARLNAFGENVSERDVTQAITTVCERHDWLVENFHVSIVVAPKALTRQNRGRHEWWIELKPGTVATPTGPHLAAELDAELQRTSAGYATGRQSAVIDPPVVRLVMPGVFEHLLRFQGQWGGQHKLLRCRSDRVIADALAHVTNFSQD